MTSKVTWAPFLYLGGQLAGLAANLLALVGLTRLLDVEDFGRISLVSSAVVIGASLCSVGLPQAAVRYLDEYRRDRRLGTLYASILFASAVFSGVGAVCTLAAGAMLPDGNSYRGMLLPAALMLVLSSVNEVVLGLHRGREEAGLYNLWLTVRRFGGVFLGLALVLWWPRAPQHYLWGLAAGEGIALVASLAVLARGLESSAVRVDRDTTLATVAYGAPFILAIAAGVFLTLADRYVIAIFGGERDVAIYVVAFGIGTALASIITRPANLVLFPAYMSRWNREGRDSTEAFLANAADWYIFLSLPLVVAAVIVGPALVTLTATSTFYSAGALMPVLVAVFLVNGFVSVAAAGLHITKRTGRFGVVTATAAVVNVALNLALVPGFGPAGAAVAGLVANVGYIVAVSRISTDVHVRISRSSIFGYTAVAVLALTSSRLVHGSSTTAVVFALGLAMCCYFAGILLFSTRKRAQLAGVLAQAKL
jgi:O-antigen/teichoic acid export membrane protein